MRADALQRQYVRTYSSIFLFIDTADIRTKTDELVYEMIVAAVDMVDVADLCFSVCNETRQHHRRASAQVCCLDLAARELPDPLYNRGTALNLDIRPHALELIHMHEAILKYRFCHEPRSL